MHILSLAPAKPERAQPASSTVAGKPRRQTAKPFAFVALLSLCVLALHPIAARASESEGKKIATTINLKVSATTVKAGQTLTLTSDISPSKATGTVTAYGALKSTGPWEAIKSATIKNGVATGSEKIPSSFDETVTVYLKAVYKGSSTYASSSSGIVKVVIEK
jgi:hypothetical protein